MAFTALEKYKKQKEEKKIKEKSKKLAKTKKEKEKARAKKKEETHKRMLKKKRDAYKPIHIKNLRKKQNARAYKKRRDAELAYHKANGDVQGYYRIVLTKNYEQIEELSYSWWMLTAYEKFNKYIEENNKDVICEKIIAQSNIQDAEPIKNEILLLKKIDPEYDNGIREFRNEIGTFVENRIENNNKYAIIAKNDWYIPETYNVYGYNPITDRKTGRWVLENIILNENFKLIYMCDNKLIAQYDNDFDFVVCKNAKECLRLYNALEYNTPKKSKMVMFMSYIAKGRKSWLYDQLEEKTGWKREMITKNKG